MSENNITLNTKSINWFNIGLGVIGLLLIIVGTFLTPTTTQKLLFTAGSVFLLTSSVLEKHEFFAILQVVALCGTLVAFIPVGVMVKAAIPIILTIVAIIYFIRKGLLSDVVMILGCLGLLCLAAGYATSNPIVYFLGGIFLTIYSYLSYRRGHNIALLFTVLNAVFSITAGMAVYSLLMGGLV
ncbi:MAG: hypothetical protein KAT71_05390 [Gammaproteobacteria bacterium]|nr:hypothetical protein [Gammaproteobacteria bacterium]